MFQQVWDFCFWIPCLGEDGPPTARGRRRKGLLLVSGTGLQTLFSSLAGPMKLSPRGLLRNQSAPGSLLLSPSLLSSLNRPSYDPGPIEFCGPLLVRKLTLQQHGLDCVALQCIDRFPLPSPASLVVRCCRGVICHGDTEVLSKLGWARCWAFQ